VARRVKVQTPHTAFARVQQGVALPPATSVLGYCLRENFLKFACKSVYMQIYDFKAFWPTKRPPSPYDRLTKNFNGFALIS